MRSNTRGIVLIGILLLTLVATFFVGALLQMSPSRLRRTVQDERQDLAAAAARAGVEYCLAQLVEDPTWRGLSNTTTVESEHMVVREDMGNVTGWVKSDGGDWACFRLRFNYQDGPGGADSLDQPARLMPSPSISLNNLQGETEVKIPLGTGPNYSFVSDRGFAVPERSVALLVEGLVGPGLSPDGQAVLSASDTGFVSRTLEGIYQVGGFSEGLPEGAVLQAGGDTHFVLGSARSTAATDDFSGHLRLTASDQTAVMRTKGRSRLLTDAGKTSPFNFYPDMHAEVRVGAPGFSPNTKTGQEFTQSFEDPNSALMEIEWSKVATSDQQDRLRLPAGVYTVGGGDTDGTDKEQRLKYHPMSFAQYRAALLRGETPPSEPVPPGFESRVVLNGKDWTAPDGSVEKRDVIRFEKDVEVEAVGSLQDFVIIPVNGAKQKSVSDLTAVIPPEDFSRVHEQVRVRTGTAILNYLAEKTGQQTQMEFAVGGTTYTYDVQSQQLDGGVSAEVIARAVLDGQRLSFPAGSMPPALPGTLAGGINLYSGGGYPTSTGTTTGGSSTGGTSGGLSTGGGGALGRLSTGGGIDVHVDAGGGGGGGYPGQEVVQSGGGAAWEIVDPAAFLSAVESTQDVPDAVLSRNVDPMQIPEAFSPDRTVPQDLEIIFEPAEGESATIRAGGDVMLASHLSGSGGAIVAEGRIDLIGLGIDLNAGQGERDGVSLYSRRDINISTYDQKRNRFWDASIKGVIFAGGDLTVRLGEAVRSAQEPRWGKFDYMGSAIVLGNAPSIPISLLSSPPVGGTDPSELGNVAMIAEGIRLFYEPKFLAPYVEAERMIPVYTAVSVVER